MNFSRKVMARVGVLESIHISSPLICSGFRHISDVVPRSEYPEESAGPDIELTNVPVDILFKFTPF